MIEERKFISIYFLAKVTSNESVNITEGSLTGHCKPIYIEEVSRFSDYAV